MINHALRNFLNQGSYNKAESDTFVSNIMYSLTENYQEEIQACGMTQEEYNELRFKTIVKLMPAGTITPEGNSLLALQDEERDTIIHLYGRFVDHIVIKCDLTEFVREEFE